MTGPGRPRSGHGFHDETVPGNAPGPPGPLAPARRRPARDRGRRPGRPGGRADRRRSVRLPVPGPHRVGGRRPVSAPHGRRTARPGGPRARRSGASPALLGVRPGVPGPAGRRTPALPPEPAARPAPRAGKRRPGAAHPPGPPRPRRRPAGRRPSPQPRRRPRRVGIGGDPRRHAAGGRGHLGVGAAMAAAGGGGRAPVVLPGHPWQPAHVPPGLFAGGGRSGGGRPVAKTLGAFRPTASTRPLVPAGGPPLSAMTAAAPVHVKLPVGISTLGALRLLPPRYLANAARAQTLLEQAAARHPDLHDRLQ